jgi:hypothetical protein
VFDSREISGAPGEIRTPDPLLRRQTLYPTELRAPRLLLLYHRVKNFSGSVAYS